MVHHWGGPWMGMLILLAQEFALGLVLLTVLARQAEAPSRKGAFTITALAGVLWFTHGLILLFVGLLAVIEVAARPERWGLAGLRARLVTARAVLLPLLPMGLHLTLGTILHHRQFGHVDVVRYEPAIESLYDLWAHWFLGLSLISAAGLINALVLVFFAARAARARIPMFSIWALVVLAAFYFFMPLTIPGVGFLCERALPFLCGRGRSCASRRGSLDGPRVSSSRAAQPGRSGSAWISTAAARTSDDFIAAAPQVPQGARLLALNFEPHASATNTWCLIHASGMYTVLSGAHPRWTSGPTRPRCRSCTRKRRPCLRRRPRVRIREFQGVAHDPHRYCEALEQTGFSDIDCKARWTDTWQRVLGGAAPRYDYVLLWGAPSELRATMPPRVPATHASWCSRALLERSGFRRCHPASGSPGKRVAYIGDSRDQAHKK